LYAREPRLEQNKEGPEEGAIGVILGNVVGAGDHEDAQRRSRLVIGGRWPQTTRKNGKGKERKKGE